jgi:hypothetical protein
LKCLDIADVELPVELADDLENRFAAHIVRGMSKSKTAENSSSIVGNCHSAKPTLGLSEKQFRPCANCGWRFSAAAFARSPTNQGRPVS